MKCLTIFMRLACERRRASEIGIADSCNDLGAMAWAIVIWKVDGYMKEKEHQSIEWKESWQDEC